MIAVAVFQIWIAELIVESGVQIEYPDYVCLDRSNLPEKLALNVPAVVIAGRQNVAGVLRTCLVAV